MELLRCTQCKGDLQLSDDGLFGRCIFCGATYHFKNEKNSRLISLLNQANISRLKGDFDGAILAYQIALKEDETDADAYWGIVLSTFGIDYVEDKSGKFIPTCRRTIKSSIFDDENYSKALQYASTEQAKQFEIQAKEINDLQERIKEKVKEEKDYDVFICFKSTDDNSNPTKDRFVARRVYDELNRRNIRTFFSEVSLKDRLGEDFEPIIYKALYSCKFFILVATDSSYIQAPWVRNEWTRFRDRVSDEGLENRAFVLFQNMPENELPPIFRKQGIDLSKYPAGGYEIEIADGLGLKLKNEELKADTFTDRALFAEDKIVDLMDKRLKATRETFNERMDRATGYFDIGNKDKAFAILEETIDLYPRKSRAWWTMACFLTDYFKIDAEIVHDDKPMEEKIMFNYNNALRFATEKEKDEYKRKSMVFYDKLDCLTSVDDMFSNFERETERLFENKEKIEQLTKPESETNRRAIEVITQARDYNDERIKELKNQIANNTYYIKDLPKEKNWFFSFLNFISFVVFVIAIITTTVKLSENLASNTSVIGDLLGGILLFAIGSAPMIIASVAEKRKRLGKVKDVIEKDKAEFENLKKENEVLNNKILLASKTKEENQEVLVMLNEEQTRLNDSMDRIVQRMKVLSSKDYVKAYIDKHSEYTKKNYDDEVLKCVQKINEFESECAVLKESNRKKMDYDLQHRPKYYNPKYEKQQTKNKVYIQENQKYIQMVEVEISKLENDIKLFNFKKHNNFIDRMAQQEKQEQEVKQELNIKIEESKLDNKSNHIFEKTDKKEPKDNEDIINNQNQDNNPLNQDKNNNSFDLPDKNNKTEDNENISNQDVKQEGKVTKPESQNSDITKTDIEEVKQNIDNSLPKENNELNNNLDNKDNQQEMPSNVQNQDDANRNNKNGKKE